MKTVKTTGAQGEPITISGPNDSQATAAGPSTPSPSTQVGGSGYEKSEKRGEPAPEASETRTRRPHGTRAIEVQAGQVSVDPMHMPTDITTYLQKKNWGQMHLEWHLFNQEFWRLHGWIDNLWSTFRTMKGELETDPAYKKAIDDATMMMTMPMMGSGSKAPPRLDPNASFPNFFAQP